MIVNIKRNILQNIFKFNLLLEFVCEYEQSR